MNRSKRWYEYLWIVTPVYLLLGFFNILFAIYLVPARITQI